MKMRLIPGLVITAIIMLFSCRSSNNTVVEINTTQTPNAPPASTSTPVYVHPGAWSSAAELSFVKTQIAANAQPWLQQYNNLIGQTGGASSGINFNGQTQNSCTQESDMQTDSALVYANALAWYLTGNNTYYTKAMNILGNYSGMLGLQSTACYSGQCQLDASWFGVLFANACELLRTSPNWTAANTATYVNMFKTAFYPQLNTMCTGNGNIDLTQIDAMLSMAVFCDDKAEWSLAISRYQARMPAYFYDSSWPTISSSTNPDTGNNQPAAIGGDTGNTGLCTPVFPNNFCIARSNG